MPDKNQPLHSRPYEDYLLDSLRQALAPLVGLLLHRGVTYPVLSTLIKSLYVEQAQKEFQTGDKPLTDSRLSLLTGIARRYVKTFRQEDPREIRVETKASSGAKLIAEWLTDPGYLDAEGKPIPISQQADGDHIPNFEALTRRVSSDTWPGALLGSLIDMKLVAIDNRDRVHLLAGAYLPSNTSLENLEFFAAHLHDHIATLRQNLLNDNDTPLIERSAYQTELTKASVEKVQNFAEDKISKLLREVYDMASKQQQEDQDAEDATHRLRLGVYFYNEDTHQSTKDKNTNEG